MANTTIKNIECVLFYSNVYEDEQLASILTKVGASQNFSADNLSDYSNLIGHTHHIFAASGYGFEKKYFSANLEKMKKKDGTYSTRYARYCANQSRKTDETLGGQRRLDICSLCEYSVAYANARIKLEETILFYQLKTGLPVKLPSRTIKTTKNIFHSCALLCPEGTIGQYPLVGFNLLMFHALALPRNRLTEQNFAGVLDELSLYIYNEAVSKVDAFSGFPDEFFDTARQGVRMKVKTFLKNALSSTVTDKDLADAITLCAMPYSTYRKMASDGSTDEEILKSLEDKKKATSERSALRRAPLPGSVAPAISTRSASIPSTPLLTDTPSDKKVPGREVKSEAPTKVQEHEVKAEAPAKKSDAGLKPERLSGKKVSPDKSSAKKKRTNKDVVPVSKDSSDKTKELASEIEGIIVNMGSLGDAPINIDIVDDSPSDVRTPLVSELDEQPPAASANDFPVDIPDGFCPDMDIEIPSDEELEKMGAIGAAASGPVAIPEDITPDIPDIPDIPDVTDISFSGNVREGGDADGDVSRPALSKSIPDDAVEDAAETGNNISSASDANTKDASKSSESKSLKTGKKSKKKKTKKDTQDIESAEGVQDRESADDDFSLNTYTVEPSAKSYSPFIQIPDISPNSICSLDAENAAGVAGLSLLLYQNMIVFMECVSLNGTPGLLFYNDTATGDAPRYLFTSGFIGAVKDFLRCKERVILTSNALNLYYYFSQIGADCIATVHDLRLMNELSGKPGSPVKDMKSVILEKIHPKRKGDSEEPLLYCMRYYECLRGKLFGEDTTERMWQNYYALLNMEKILATYTPVFRLTTEYMEHSSCLYQIAPYTEHTSGGFVSIKINTDESHPIMIDNVPVYYHICNSLCRARTFKSFYMDISTINKNGIVLHYNSLRVHDMYDALWCMAQKTCRDLYDTIPDIYISEVSVGG